VLPFGGGEFLLAERARVAQRREFGQLVSGADRGGWRLRLAVAIAVGDEAFLN
jgi:hypothetical protein